MLPLMAARWYGFRSTVSGFASSSLKLNLHIAAVFVSLTGVRNCGGILAALLGMPPGPSWSHGRTKLG